MKVKVLTHCHCIRKLKYDKVFEYDDKKEALKKAEEIIDVMNEKSCHTHELTINQKDDDIEISSKVNFKSW
jgi:hypothetical protein